MARIRPEFDAEQKPRPDLYVGMLALAAGCMFVGVLLMAFEANEYGWESEPRAVQPVSLPAPLPPQSAG